MRHLSFGLVAACALIGFTAGCSLVLDDPTPFIEARQDAAELDQGPLLPDLAVEDAFVARPPRDMTPDAAPDAASDMCPDAGCEDARP